MNKKWFVGVIVVIFVIFGVVEYFVLKPVKYSPPVNVLTTAEINKIISTNFSYSIIEDYKISYPKDATVTNFDNSKCIIVKHGIGYVGIGFNIYPCGGTTGLGVGDKKVTDDVNINGEQYQTNGFVSPDNSFSFIGLNFPAGRDVFYITYGVEANTSVSQTDYTEAINDIKSIISTFGMTTPDTTGWNSYSSTQYGFSFNYPSSWQVSEKTDKNGNKYVALSSGIDSDIKGVPTEEIDFSVVGKNYFNPPIGTKIGLIGYDSVRNALVDTESPPEKCVPIYPLLEIPNAPSSFEYDGSLMSDPAHSNYALMTKNGNIILVTELTEGAPNQNTGWAPDPNIDSRIANSLGLLNGDSIVPATCSN